MREELVQLLPIGTKRALGGRLVPDIGVTVDVVQERGLRVVGGGDRLAVPVLPVAQRGEELIATSCLFARIVIIDQLTSAVIETDDSPIVRLGRVGAIRILEEGLIADKALEGLRVELPDIPLADEGEGLRIVDILILEYTA